MATWMQRRLGRDPSSSAPSAPPEPPSPTHARLSGALNALATAAAGKADAFPGGEAMAKLILGKARQMAAARSEAELRQWMDFLGRLARAVGTGEGYEELLGGEDSRP